MMTSSMGFSEQQIKDAVELKDSLIEEVEKHQDSIAMLEKNIQLLDMIIKGASFTKASNLTKPEKIESVPIRSGVGETIANAYLTADQVSIKVDAHVNIDVATPPFQSFFLDRIIKEMTRKDKLELDKGSIKPDQVLDYTIKKDGSDIREIIVKNYRQRERADEIINTVGWTFKKMLEKT